MIRRVAELSFPRRVLKDIKCLIQRDSKPNGGDLQGQEQRLPVTSHPAPVLTPTAPVSTLPPPAMLDPPFFSPPSPQSPVAIPLGFQDETMEGNVSNPVPTLTKHHEFMRHALEMAEIALKTDEVPVGCVFVHKGEIIGKGMNDTNRSLCGTRHAEFVALEHILKTKPPSIFQETDLYVTVEPCIMCASALRQLKIRAVYFGCLNDRFGGCGGVFHIDQDPSIDLPYPCFGGVYREEAIMLLRRFYIQENERAPAPIAKKNRELKTEIASIEVMEGRAAILKPEIASLEPLEAMAARPKLVTPRVDPLSVITA
ncbi:cytidine deaminase-like protein [Tirmania nivea]|nr:cytidine deaminase-like protein [Tirmania nivea]